MSVNRTEQILEEWFYMISGVTVLDTPSFRPVAQKINLGH